ncbi:MAG: CNNM domain-containing protein [Rickettsiales bacterium]|nr:CNNM domain-containing protein [Rickettsiales bacterium]
MTNSVEFDFIIVVTLIFISALFACFETAIVATSKAKIHRLSNEGNKRAKVLERLLQSREKVISTMLFGNNAINILSSAIATSLAIKLFGDSGLVIATVSMTLIVLIFAEVIPKTYAVKSPDEIALFFAPLINFLVMIFFPITDSVHKLVNFFFVVKNKKSSAVELEEIRDTINLKHKEGSIYKYDKDMIDGVLDLADTEISEIMVHRKDMETINIEAPIKEIIRLALESSYTRIPLWQGNKENIVAILNVRKLLKALHFYKGDLEKFNLKLITTEVWFVPASNSLRTQLFLFRKRRRRMALVIDEYSSLIGMVTLEDILEEIVGEIKEKENSADANIIKIKSGAYKIFGRSLIRDINKKLDWNISEDDNAYNLTAFIINSLGRIPEERENFVIADYYFEILKKRNNDLLLIKAKKLKTSDNAAS